MLPASAELVTRLETWCPRDQVPPGARLPLPVEVAGWMRSARRMVKRGGLVVVDYAAAVAELVDRGPSGWLRTYHGHRRGDHPLRRPGSQDITIDLPVEAAPRGHPVAH